LTPELAQDMAACDQVFFVDACAGGAEETVEVLGIKASESVAAIDHASNPRAMLAFTRAVFGVCPAAWWIMVPGIDFELGEGLTAHAERGLAVALRTIARLLNDEQSFLPCCES
jgi:Ni,Fe-hydrogenase maturation factor